ncbi:hypothetical protein P5673_025269, partial [Acropora cervicornis]
YHCSYFPGLNRENSFTNRGGSAWEHRSGEERNSISPVWLTVVVTIIFIAVLLYQCMRYSVPEDVYEAMFEAQSSQPEDSGDTFIRIRVEDPSGSYQEHGADGKSM